MRARYQKSYLFMLLSLSHSPQFRFLASKLCGFHFARDKLTGVKAVGN